MGSRSLKFSCVTCGNVFARARPDANRQITCSLLCRLTHHSEPTASGCINWTGASHRFGYGVVRIDGKTRTAHRLALELYQGALTPGAQVLHSCDNPRCINPLHLREGTHAENMGECTARGRHGMQGRRHSEQTRALIGANRGKPTLPPPEIRRQIALRTWEIRRARYGAAGRP